MDKVVILAAGANSRFWPLASTHHKAFYKVGAGKTIIEETVSHLLPQAKEITIVVAPRDLERARQLFSQDKIKIQVLEKPTGGGNAILKALSSDYSGNFFVTTGDKINAGKILEKLGSEEARSASSGQAIALRKTNTPEHFGMVGLDKSNNITSVVEKPQKDKAPSEYKITQCYLLNSSFLPYLEELASEHYSLELALDRYVGENKVKGVFVDETPDVSLKFPWDILEINKEIQTVHLGSQHIDPSAQVSKTAVIKGSVYIEKGARISDFVKIVGPAYIGENAYVGDFCLVRNNSFIDQNVVIGSHSEVKNSFLYKGTTVHRSYVGDSIIDENGRIGGGVVFANRRYDRKEIRSVVKGEKISTGTTFLGSILGPGVSVGANATLMPGVKAGKNSIIWPGKVVFEDVPDEETVK